MGSALMVALRRLDDAIATVENVAIVFLCASLAVLLFTNVLLRYLFRSPFAWIDEVVIAAFVWMIFLGVSACVRSHQHLRIDIVWRALPGSARQVVGLFAVAVMLVVIVSIIYNGYHYAVFVAGNITPILGISAAWLYVGLPLGMAFAAVHLVRQTMDEGSDQVLQSVLERDE